MLNSRNSLLAKNTLILGIGQLIPKLTALVTLPILTRHLTTESYGIYDIILSIGSIAIPVLTLLIQQAAFRFIINSKNNKKEVISSTFFCVVLLSILWGIITVIVALWGPFDTKLVLMIYVLYLLEALYDTVGQIIRGNGQNIVFSIGVAILSGINLLLIILLFLTNCISIWTVIITSSLSYVISFAFICYRGKIFQYVSVNNISMHLIWKMLKYSLPIIPSAISLWIVNLSDRLLIMTFLGVTSNGIYAAANKIPNLCGTVYSVFNLAWTEIASRTVDDEDRDCYYTELFNTLFSFLIGIFLILIVISPFMFQILIGEKYISGLQQMPFLFIGIFYSSMVSFLGGIYVALQRTKQVGVSAGVGAVINLFINAILISKVGLYAASVSTLISYLLIYIYRRMDLRRFINIKIDKKRVFTGYIFLGGITLLYYLNIKWMVIIGVIIGIGYNLKYNMPMLKLILRKCIH